MQLDIVMSGGNKNRPLIDTSERREEIKGRKYESKHVLIGFVEQHVTSKAI